MVPQGLERRTEEVAIKERIKTIQITTLFRLAGILQRVLETCEDMLLTMKNHQLNLIGKTHNDWKLNTVN